MTGRASLERLAPWLLVVVVAAALAVRLHGLRERTLIQAEAYAPRIDYPEWCENPYPRVTLADTLRSVASDDKHPPAYYVLLWLWTGAFGTGIGSLRLPSVLLGVATILGLYRLARRDHGGGIALFAAALLSANCVHIFYSQIARMWVPATLLAVASVALLADLERGSTRLRRAAYVVVSALGLWSEYYFFPFLGAQLLSTLFGRLPPARARSLLRLQAAAFLLACPIVTYMRVHSFFRHELADDTWGAVTELLGFNGMVHRAALLPWRAPWGAALYALLVAAGLALLVAGARWRLAAAQAQAARAASAEPSAAERETPRSSNVAPFAAAVVASLGSLALAAFHVGGWKINLVAALLPWPLLLLWRAVDSRWEQLVAPLQRIRGTRIVRLLCADRYAALIVLTPLPLVAVSLAVHPVIVSRGLLLLAPFCLLLVACGVAALARLWIAAGAVTAALLTMGALGVRHAWTTYHVHPRDYLGLSQRLTPLLRQGEPLVLENGWWSQPLLYYVNHRLARIEPAGPWDRRLRDSPLAAGSGAAIASFWFVVWRPEPLLEHGVAAQDDEYATAGFARTGRVDARGAAALHYERR